MGNYFVKLMNGSVFEITQSERNDVAVRNGLLYFPSCDRTINSASITEIVSAYDYEIDRMLDKQKNQKEGVLHDGKYAYKHFGEWAFDEDGTRYIISDPSEYPEISANCVPTKLEWETKYKKIADRAERLKAILGTFQDITKRIDKMSAIGQDDFKRLENFKRLKI